MRRLTVIAHVSLDGVIQAPGAPDEDGDYPYGGWAAPFRDPVAGKVIGDLQQPPFDLILGRNTYDIFASYWPHQTGQGAKNLNAATKYVATHRKDSLGWGPAEAIGTDLTTDVDRLKTTDGSPLIVWGSSTVTPLIVSSGLADAVVLLVFPIFLGTGKRVFSDIAAPCELALEKSVVGPTGVLVNSYRPAGPLRTGTMGDD